MPTPQKVTAVAEIKKRLESSKVVVVAEYRGLDVGKMTQLRQKTRQAGVEFKVYKNRLATVAAQEANIEGLESLLAGPNGFAFGYDDPVTAAKVLAEFSSANEQLVIKGGLVEGAVVDAAGIKALAELPSREVLLSMVLRAMQGPVSGLVNVLDGTIRGLVYALDAIRKQKEEAVGA